MKTLKQASLLFIFLTIITCVIYPAFVMAVSQTFYKFEANGEILTHKGVAVGSELIAQEFKSDKFFWARPSAANYNGESSSGSNYALTNPDFHKAVEERKAQGLDFDLLTTSGSGLDPHISPRAAILQIERVAKARNMDAGKLKQLVTEYIEPRQLGFLGEERVNVLKLNLGLENLVHE